MKAIILAAGKGTRMLPLTKDIPKVLVPINGKPFLSYLIENLKQAGLTDLGIVVGYKKEKIAGFLKQNNIKAALIEQKEPIGSANAVQQVESFVKKESFIVLVGDNLWSPKDLKEIAKEDSLCYIIGYKVNNPEHYGVLITDPNSMLKEIKEKPKEFVGNFINTGAYKFTPEIFQAIKQIKPSAKGEYEIVDAITILAKQGKVKVLKVQDYWIDCGKLEDIPIVEDFLNKQKRLTKSL